MMVGIVPNRPLLRYLGGKWLLAPWIIAHFPDHEIYVEPFGGAASVLLRKDRAYTEVYNDIDQGVVNLFRVLRQPDHAQQLIAALNLTPFARTEFELAYEPCDDPVEHARRMIVRSFMGFGADGTGGVYKTGFRANSNRSGSTYARDWSNYPAALATIVARISGVTVESRDAMTVMADHDGPRTLHYVDPPYVPVTRSAGSRRRGAGYHTYVHDMGDDDHRQLLAALQDLRGMVVLSGYPSDLYDQTLIDWKRVERVALADGARPRTEVLWLNAAADAALGHGPLFEF